MPRPIIASRFWSPFFLLITAVILLTGPICPSYADGVDATVRLSPQQAAQFHSALVALEAQGHVTLVAEGSPFTPSLVGKVTASVPLTPEQIKMVPQNLIVPLPLGEAITRIAKAYDYSVERRPGLFLLRKRYTDPADLPGVTLEECTLALQDVRTLLTTFLPYKPPTGYANAIVSTFSPEQQATFWRKDATSLDTVGGTATLPLGLPPPPHPLTTLDTPPAIPILVADMASQQQTAVKQWVAESYLQDSLDSLDRVLPLIKAAPQTSIGVGTINDGPVVYTVFGFQSPDPGSPPPFYPFWNELDSRASAIQTQLAHPTKIQEAAIQGRDDAAKGDGHVTLLQEGVILSGRGLRLTVDPALRAKPITVVGEADIAPNEVVKGIADVYGLRAFTKEDGTMSLTRWPLQIPDDITGLADEVWRLLPAPLARAIHVQDEAALQIRIHAPQPDPNVPASSKVSSLPASTAEAYWPAGLTAPSGDPGDDDSKLDRFIVTILPDRIKQPALERLRAALDCGAVPAQDGNLVPLSSLTDGDRADFAIAFLTDFPHNACLWFSSTPYYLEHFDIYSLRITIYPDPSGSGKKMISMVLDPPSDNTGNGSHDGPGLGGALYTPGP